MNKCNLLLGILLSIPGIFSACNDTDETTPTVVGDVFVRCQTIDGKTMYAPVYYAYSNYAISNANVSHNGAAAELTNYYNRTDVFRKVPGAEDYSETPVSTGEYAFIVDLKKGDKLTVSDNLLEGALEPVEITEFTYDNDKHTFAMKWNTVSGADFYVVRLTEGIDKASYFTSSALTQTSYEFFTTTQGWSVNSIEAGTNCFVVVYAYKYENSVVKSGYDLNWESVAYKTIEW